jgi:hypothetical protein
MVRAVGDRFGVDMPVDVIDRLAVRPGCQREVLRRMTDEYRPLADARGLHHIGTLMLPPFDRPDAAAEILIRWQYPSLGSFWAARGAEEGDERLSAFWTALDLFLIGRTRQLGRPGLIEGMGPPIAGFSPGTGRPRAIAFVRPAAPHDAAGRAEWIARIEALGGRGGFNAGAYTGRPDELTIDVDGKTHISFDALGTVEEVVTLGDSIDIGFREPKLRDGVKRTILLRTIGDALPEPIILMEQGLQAWARHLPEMRNWSIARVASASGPIAWTHVFEQEFADVADITGAYLNHPFHWAVVDRFFHREAPERVADAFFHSIYPITRSVLAGAANA